MPTDANNLSEILKEVRKQRPLVHQMTNYVSAQLQADTVAIMGGCSIMSVLATEIEEITAQADALLINTGAPGPDFLGACRMSLDAAERAKIPVLLDIVGYGFTKFRSGLADTLLGEYSFSAVKGNSAEISALAGDGGKPKGVSVPGGDIDMGPATERLAAKYGCVVISTGAVDTLSDGMNTLRLGGGSRLMATRSGMGCALGSLAALFLSVTGPFAASAAACAAFRLAAERAADTKQASASFLCAFQDELHLLADNTADWGDLIVR